LSSDPQPDRVEVEIALGELNQFSEKLSIPVSVTDEAARIFKKSLRRGLARGRPLSRVAAASLYAACREREVPATLADVSAASGVGRKVLAGCYRMLVTELDLKIPVADPAECLASVASRAKVGPKVEKDAREILSEAERAGITDGVYPQGLAASALYLAALLNGCYLTQTGAAEAAGVREVTVRNQFKRLRKLVKARLKGTTRKKSPRRLELEADRSVRVEVPA
jgi:transcription initiation factor TFIIB